MFDGGCVFATGKVYANENVAFIRYVYSFLYTFFFNFFSFVGEKNGIFSNLSLVDSIWHHHLIGLVPKKSIKENRVSGLFCIELASNNIHCKN